MGGDRRGMHRRGPREVIEWGRESRQGDEASVWSTGRLLTKDEGCSDQRQDAAAEAMESDGLKSSVFLPRRVDLVARISLATEIEAAQAEKTETPDDR